jgi:hypothetical protein
MDDGAASDLLDVGDGGGCRRGADDARSFSARAGRLAVLEADLVRGAALAADRVRGPS